MTDTEPADDSGKYTPAYWRKVYFLVLAFLAFFCLFMYLFTRLTS